MSRTLSELVALTESLGPVTICGDASRTVTDALPFGQTGPNDLSFFTDAAKVDRIDPAAVAALLTTEPVAEKIRKEIPTDQLPLLICDDPQAVLLALIPHLRTLREHKSVGVSPAATIDPTATLGTDTEVHPQAIIGEGVTVGERCVIHSGVVIGPDCRIGDDCILYPNVVLYADCRLDNRVTVHANSVLGADGYGYRQEGGRHVKQPHYGWVELHDDVEIGACTTIDRGMFGATIVGEGSKIDNLVQIAHQCRLGQHNLLVAQVGLAGSVTTGDYVVLAGQVGVADHVHLGTGAVVGSKAGVHKDLAGGQTYLGAPAEPVQQAMRHMFVVKQVPKLKETVKGLQKELAAIREQLGTDDESAAA